MGNFNSKSEIIYNLSTENSDKAYNETHVYRNPANLHELKQFPFATVQEIMANAFSKNSPQAPCILQRELDSDRLIEHSYAKVRADAELFGRGVLELQLAPPRQDYRDYSICFLGIYAPNVYRYIIHEWACIMHGIVSAPVYDTHGEQSALFPFENTGIETLCLTVSKLEKVMNLKKTEKLHFLKNLVILDKENLPQDVSDLARETGFRIYTWEDVVERGRGSQITEWAPVQPGDVICYCFTSGSTGTPKGAVYTHENLASGVQALQERLQFVSTDRHLNFFPMAHMFERFFLLMCLNVGAKIHLSNPDPRRLGEDFIFHRPTILVTAPSLYNKFYNDIKEQIEKKRGTLAGSLIQRAVNAKLCNLESSGAITHPIYDTLVFKKVRAVTGGCIRIMASTTAPLNSEVANFLKIALSCPLLEGYGLTEAGPAFTGDFRDPSLGHVGGVLSHDEFKLVDIPEMGYTSRDVDPQTGLVVPRGEIWVRGRSIIPGYYKNDAKNAEAFTQDGWLRTGDVGKIVAPWNRLIIIDRKQSMFKLSCGSFISPEKLECSYKTCTGLFTDVFIYGDSYKSFLLAVITVEPENLKAVAELVGMDGSAISEKLLGDPDFEKRVLAMLEAKAKDCKFVPREVPRGIVFNSTPFKELGLKTISFKPKRNKIKEYFKDQFGQKYDDLEQ